MLSHVGTPQPIQGAMGQYSRASCQFQSDTALAGKTVRFNPGLYSNQANAPNGAIAYTLPYPATAGSYDMAFNAPPVWKNHKATLEVIDGFNFRITLKFFFTKPSGYIGGAIGPDHQDPFSGSPSSVAMNVRVGADEAYCFIPTQVTPFCSDPNMSVSVDYTDGVKVSFEYPGFMPYSAFVGVYRTDNISGTAGLIDDLTLNYGELGIGVQPVDSLPVSCMADSTPFAAGGGFLSSGTIATLTLGCVQPGQTYRAYIVYNPGSGWQSCQSAEISTTSTEPVIAGSVEYAINDGTNTFTSGCLTGVPPCKALTVSVKMDKATYDAALVAAGLTGVQSDYFTTAKVSVQNQFNNAQTGPLLSSTINLGADGVTATFTHNADPGTVYLVFGFVYTFPDRTDTILIPVQIDAVTYAELGAPSEFCAENTDTITAQLPETPGATLITQYDTPGRYEAATGIVVNGSVLEIDPTSVPIGTTRCYEICTEDVTATDQPCVCDCDCIDVYYEGVACLGERDYRATLGVNGLLASEVSTVRIETTNGALTTLLGTEVTFNGIADERFPISFFIRGTVTLKNGCVYDVPLKNFELSSGGNGNEPCNLRISERICQSTCDCAEVPPDAADCENFAVIAHACIGDEITLSHSQTFGSPVGVDVIECSLDDVNYGPCAASYTGEVYVKRTVNFTDGCPPLNLSYVARCEIDRNCINSASLDIATTETELTVSVVGNYNSQVSSETVYYSINGGSDYLIYGGMVALDGSEELRVYSVTTFEDGCPDVITPIQDASGPVTGSEPFVSYCNEDGDIVGFALAVIDENGVNTIYFDADMQPRVLAPAGTPCEAFEPCLTCP